MTTSPKHWNCDRPADRKITVSVTLSSALLQFSLEEGDRSGKSFSQLVCRALREHFGVKTKTGRFPIRALKGAAK